MDHRFFDNPILNSPYRYPSRHWELDADGQPTRNVVESRRRAEFISPIPKPKKRGGRSPAGRDSQESLVFDEGKGLSTREQQYEQHAGIINGVRREVGAWRRLPDPRQWRVTPETARLLRHWRHHRFTDIRPFFCQIEAVETAIWLAEVAPHAGRPALPPVPGGRRRGSESGAAPPRAQARHRRGQDHRDGHADRLADRQRGAPAAQPPIHPGVPGRHPRPHHPGPAAGAPTDRGEDARDKKAAMETCWVPGVNRHGDYGRWAFAELRDVYTMRDDLEARSGIQDEFERLVGPFLREARVEAGRYPIMAGGAGPDLDDVPRRKSPMPG